MEKYKNKYRIASARAPFWDYRWNAAYFVTICTKNRICWFGKISNGVMKLSAIGEIVNAEWLKTFKIRPDMNLFMGEYVVMPNHFHAIIGIGENQYNTQREMQRGAQWWAQRRDAMHSVPTDKTDKTNDNNHPMNQFGPQSKNLASIIRGFKSAVTQKAGQIHPDLAWQPRYYDHIIRNKQSFQKITTYIKNNPAKWKNDKFHR